MEKKIDVSVIENEIKSYVNTNPPVMNAAVMSSKVEINKYARLITKIGGKYATVNAVMGHVVQAYKPKWEPMGDVQISGKLSRSFHQKVNFQVRPSDILGSWIAQKYDEDKKDKDKTISKHVMTMLGDKIISDVNILSMTGVYDETKALADTPEFGYSMDGISTILRRNSTNTENPYYKIPIDAITEDNVWDQYKEFDKALPKDFIHLIPFIACSHKTYTQLKEYYNDHKSGDTNHTKSGFKTSPINELPLKKITGLPDGIFACWADGNLMRLIDLIENPGKISKVVDTHYGLDLVGEFTLGYDFGINQLVIIGTSNATVAPERGLGDAKLNELYYPQEYGKITSPTLTML